MLKNQSLTIKSAFLANSSTFAISTSDMPSEIVKYLVSNCRNMSYLKCGGNNKAPKEVGIENLTCVVFPEVEHDYAMRNSEAGCSRAMKTSGGVTTNGDKGNDMLPMNSRGWMSLMNPKAYVVLQIPT